MEAQRHPDNFLSNMERKDKPALIKAAQVTKTKVYTQDKAYDFNGRKLPDCIAILSSDMEQDHSDMWCQFNEYKSGRF